MPLNDTGMTLIANTLQGSLLYAQLHSGFAGAAGTDDIAVAGRHLAAWTTPAATFGLVSQIDFTGGTPGGPVYSVTLWDAETSGVLYGEFVLAGDATFNNAGEYQVTAIDFTGTTS